MLFHSLIRFQEIIQTIERGAEDPFIPFAVFKVTGIADFSLLE